MGLEAGGGVMPLPAKVCSFQTQLFVKGHLA